MSQIGGNNSREFIRRILIRLLCDNVAKEYSYVGGKGKQKFCLLKINKVIKRAVKLNVLTKDCNEKKIEQVITSWLSKAPIKRQIKKLKVMNKPWAQGFLKICLEMAKKTVLEVKTEQVEESESLEIRRTELRELHQKQMALCRRLGREPKFLNECSLPDQTEIDNLRMEIVTLERETVAREEKFFQWKEQISEIFHMLQITPSTDFEKYILLLNLPNNEVLITDYDMEKLVDYKERLVRYLETVRDETRKLRAKINDLWDILATDEAERDAFRQQDVGNYLITLKKLTAQVEKLEKEKKTNLKALITKQRQELRELWGKCNCSQKQKDSFVFFNSESFSEALFKEHCKEISKWKKYYRDNIDIFALLYKDSNELDLLNVDRGAEIPPKETSSYRPPTSRSGSKRKVFNPLAKPSKKIKSALKSKSVSGVPKEIVSNNGLLLHNLARSN